MSWLSGIADIIVDGRTTRPHRHQAGHPFILPLSIGPLRLLLDGGFFCYNTYGNEYIRK
jgi:hypothetical protein